MLQKGESGAEILTKEFLQLILDIYIYIFLPFFLLPSSLLLTFVTNIDHLWY